MRATLFCLMPIVDDRPHKPLLDAESLREVMTLSLWAGQMLLQHGADSQRVEETVHRMGTAMGADWMDIQVMPDAIIASTVNNHEFRTKVRRAPNRGADFAMIDALNMLSRRVVAGEVDRHDLRRLLREIDEQPAQYNRWLVVLGVGLACASLSRLFGGTLPVFVVTFVASAAAMFVRQELHRRHFNFLVTTIATSFVATALAAVAVHLHLGPRPTVAISASVILLVPGALLITAASDMIRGYTLNGIGRGVQGFVIVLGIALGMVMGIWLMGVGRL